ncbi:MAG TPA: hypothetical protein PLA65_20405 [Spirochaetota bacterium]|nr:hypothetical protein [Spirochaetota bacterium]HPN14431.1 hypothetical protein [Spirochaetota bacterium]
MEKDITSLVADSRWNVIFSDPGSWRVGLYRPEHDAAGKVEVLEKHSCHELFVCMGGKTGLIVKNGMEEEILELAPGQALLVTGYHNGYAIDPEGFFLVVERTDFSTEYADRGTGEIVKRVTVGNPG